MSDLDLSAPQCHIVSLAELSEDYQGQLSVYQAKMDARNLIITMEVKMSVAGGRPRPHAAALAVSHDYQDAEELMTMAKQCFSKKTPFAFGWVPANLYGSDKFGIFIEPGEMGELLANGLIDDIIVQANVEQAVASD
mgnify:CR=1 FL=1